MGFYGNITNTIKTNLTFDRKYCNRWEMDRNCATDGVYAGRYVLVEYDLSWDADNITNDDIPMLYSRTIGTNTQYSLMEDFSVIFYPIEAGVLYRAVDIEDIVEGEIQAYANTYLISYEQSPGIYRLRVIVDSESNYVVNFNIDKEFYGDGRGYDSTVWTKVYDENGIPSYVMVAELNSVIPTFAISVDTPTEIPIAPHFDENNTNIFYTLHLQPNWGFRIKASEGNSDIEGPIKTYTFNERQEITDTQSTTGPLNIYYNKAGFDSQNRNISSLSDAITFEPTGKSGRKFEDASNNHTLTEAIDLYEFSLLIPSLGNAVSNMWDQVYEADESGRLRKLDVAWKYVGEEGAETPTFKMSTDLNTLAGSINMAHYLMGMIITKENSNLENIYINHQIYYDESENKYYRVARDLNLVTTEDTSDKTKTYYGYNNEAEKYEVINPNTTSGTIYTVDSSEPYLYKLVELIGYEKNVSTMNGILVQMAEKLGLNDENSLDEDTVQGILNRLHSIIDVFGDLISGEIVIVDSEGHLVSAHINTNQSWTYTNEATGITSSSANADNKWITAAVHPDTRVIDILHTVASEIEGQNTITNFDTSSESQGEFSIYKPIVDNAGHIVGRNNQTIFLPMGLKTINSNGTSTSATNVTGVAGSLVASSIKDSFDINVGNKWINSNASGKTLTLGHVVSNINVDTNQTDFGTETDNNSFIVQELIWDEAGHITSNINHTYELPFAYSKFSVTPISTNTLSDFSTAVPIGINPLSLNSTLSIVAGNTWIQMEGNQDQISFAHKLANPTVNEANQGNVSGNVTINTYNYDNAGHITSITPTVYSIQTFKNISIGNVTIASSLLADSLNLGANNNWINITGNAGSKTIEFGHADPQEAAINIVPNVVEEDTALVLNFGDTFKIPEFSYDGKGHIVTSGLQTLQLPAVPSTTNITLEGYQIADSYSNIEATDTVLSGLAKLEAGLQVSDISEKTVTIDDTNTDTIKNILADLIGRVTVLETPSTEGTT